MSSLANALSAGFDQRWRALSFLKQLLIVVGFVAAGAGVGALTGSSDGVRWGIGMAAAFMIAVAGFVWWREVSKTILGLFFFMPLTLLSAQGQAEIVAPLAPVPTITTVPLLLWMAIVGVVVHRVNVPRQWLRAVVVVQTAGIIGWVLGLFLGSMGVLVGYVISAVLLYVLTFGWQPLQQRRLNRSLMRAAATGNENGDEFSLPVNAAGLRDKLGDGWTVIESVVLPGTEGHVEFPVVLVGPSEVLPVVKRKHSGVVREEQSGVAFGGEPAATVLGPVAAAAAQLAKDIKVPVENVRPVYVPSGSSLHRGRADVSLYDGSRKVFDVLVVSEKRLVDGVLSASAQGTKLSEKERERAVARLESLQRVTQTA